MEPSSSRSDAPLTAEISPRNMSKQQKSGETMSSKEDFNRENKDKMTAADFTEEALSSDEKLQEYFKNLTEKVSDVVSTESGVEIRVLKWIEGTVNFEDYIIFLPMILDGERLCALLRSTNLYLVGVQTSDSECTLFAESRDQTADWGNDRFEKTFYQCMDFYGIDVNVVSIKESYTGLQQLAGITRATMKLGKNALISAHGFLSRSNWDDKNGIANSLLVITQFFCEPLRIKAYAEFLFCRFLANGGEGVDIPLIYILLQHAWGSASESLLRYVKNNLNFDVRVADYEPPLSFDQLRRYYGVLIHYSDEWLKSPPKLHQQNMAAKYLWSFHEFSFLTNYCKSTAPVELKGHEEDQYSVKAVKHIFDAYVVIEYTCSHQFPGETWKNVWVNVKNSEDEKDLPVATKYIPSLGLNFERQIFVAFTKPMDVTRAQFLNTLSFTVNKDDTFAEKKVEYKLKNLELCATDYIEKIGFEALGEKWENINQRYERVDKFSCKGSSPYNNLSSFMKGVTDIICMHPCEGSAAVPEHATLHTCLLSGIFMKVLPVLVKLTIKFNNAESVHMKLTSRCKDGICGIHIHGVVRNWLRKTFDVCTWDEDIRASDGEDSEEDEQHTAFIYGTRVEQCV